MHVPGMEQGEAADKSGGGEASQHELLLSPATPLLLRPAATVAMVIDGGPCGCGVESTVRLPRYWHLALAQGLWAEAQQNDLLYFLEQRAGLGFRVKTPCLLTRAILFLWPY